MPKTPTPSALPFEENKPLRELSTIGIGGPARYFIAASTIEMMQKTLLFAQQHQLPYFILGKGSNCLFDDHGFDGIVILNKIDFFHRPAPGLFHVGAGYSFSRLGAQTAREGWSGLEFASGIPGSVGGAIFMNAGANGRETSNCLVSVDFVTAIGEHTLFKKEELLFRYRTSSFQSMKGAIVGGTFQLSHSPSARPQQLEIITYRKATQPYQDKSAGCIFRNPPGGHAGAFIEQSGLKGIEEGGAKVSERHANFIINKGNASSQDVLKLIDIVKEKVKEKYNVNLECEILYIPFTNHHRGH